MNNATWIWEEVVSDRREYMEIPIPPFWQAALGIVLVIVLLGWLFRGLANHFYNRGWYDCESRHAHFDTERGAGSAKRERI